MGKCLLDGERKKEILIMSVPCIISAVLCNDVFHFIVYVLLLHWLEGGLRGAMQFLVNRYVLCVVWWGGSRVWREICSLQADGDGDSDVCGTESLCYFWVIIPS